MENMKKRDVLAFLSSDIFSDKLVSISLLEIRVANLPLLFSADK